MSDVNERPARPARVASAERAAPDWDFVRKRNSVERLKHEKHPLDLLQEVPEMGERNYLDIPEEDMVRFQWYGLYHDKPKVGTFMMRLKIPGGIVTPQQYRAIGELSEKYGRGYTELTTRQTVQLHWIRIKDLPEVFAAMDAVGLTSLGGCGDTVRNITGCPVAGLDHEELFDPRPVIEEVTQYFLTHREYFDLPRKHKINISTCVHQCSAPEINCISFLGAKQRDDDGSERLGFSVHVGGGLSSTPRIARDMGVFVAPDEVLPVAKAILDVWRTDLKYRTSRAKSRLKFLVDDYGADGVRAAVEKLLGRTLEDLKEAPRPLGSTDHMGVHEQKQPGLYSIGFPVFMGLVNAEQTRQIADLVESFGGDIRLGRQQNFILTGVPEARLDEVIQTVAEIGFPIIGNSLRGSSIACTGQPLCNFAVAETKTKLREIVLRLEDRFGGDVPGLNIGLDGCPHACAHHWVSDIGLQGTTVRGEIGEAKREGYEIYLRGGLGANAAIGKAILRRIPAEDVTDYVERLVGAYLAERGDDETFQGFAQRKSDDELITIASGQPPLVAADADAE